MKALIETRLKSNQMACCFHATVPNASTCLCLLPRSHLFVESLNTHWQAHTHAQERNSYYMPKDCELSMYFHWHGLNTIGGKLNKGNITHNNAIQYNNHA